MTHLLSLADHGRKTLEALLARAVELKAQRHAGTPHTPLTGKSLVLIFEKASTRTRVSFEVGMYQLGGHAVILSPRDSQIGRGEPLEDTARVLSRYADGIVIRTFDQATVAAFAGHATVPVINGLTDALHPCQVLADLQTIVERRGPLEEQVIAWVGDGNNMAHSYLNAARVLGFELRLACPAGYHPEARYLDGVATATLTEDPAEAVDGATVVVTDVWASMGQEAEQQAREQAFAGFRLDDALLAGAAADHLVLHCLPAHRGEEISAEVLEGPHSAVFDAAENRLHVQKALLEWLLAPEASPVP